MTCWQLKSRGKLWYNTASQKCYMPSNSKGKQSIHIALVLFWLLLLLATIKSIVEALEKTKGVHGCSLRIKLLSFAKMGVTCKWASSDPCVLYLLQVCDGSLVVVTAVLFTICFLTSLLCLNILRLGLDSFKFSCFLRSKLLKWPLHRTGRYGYIAAKITHFQSSSAHSFSFCLS